ncbi:putative MFS family arabinose efflux permease [Streptococcus moroccensis]|uniref:MFS family arabinose efflux permease n=1 Tax=Streptococcus moroccensis TaxID=1451356 RepID=A0ABT9YV39_9STRE|nr:putative MFS family arabinose efflux permease [Streptococcus moroccensis]
MKKSVIYLTSEGQVPIPVYFQKHVVPQQQGRIFSILDIVIQISIPLGTVIYGILFDYFSFVSTFLISGAKFQVEVSHF